MEKRIILKIMLSQKIKSNNSTYLYFPLAKLGKNKSIFSDPDRGIFAEKYKSVMKAIIGKQLALNTYYANDLIALANTKITIDLLKVFDDLRINFKVNFNEITVAYVILVFLPLISSYLFNIKY